MQTSPSVQYPGTGGFTAKLRGGLAHLCANQLREQVLDCIFLAVLSIRRFAALPSVYALMLRVHPLDGQLRQSFVSGMRLREGA